MFFLFHAVQAKQKLQKRTSVTSKYDLGSRDTRQIILYNFFFVAYILFPTINKKDLVHVKKHIMSGIKAIYDQVDYL